MRYHKVNQFIGVYTKKYRPKPLILIAVLMAVVAVPQARATQWQHLCQGLGEFAEVLTDYRNQGTPLQDAVTAALPDLRVMPDRTIATEIAQQVYATPGLDRNQEAAAIFTKCLTPAGREASERRSTRRISDLSAIPLQPGVNHIAGFASDGRDANIILSWRNEADGHGRDLFLVTMQGDHDSERRRVDLQEHSSFGSDGGITDDPHRGDDMLRSIRFARGRVDGQGAVLLLVVSRDESNDATPTEATYEVYQLIRSDGRDAFERIKRQKLPERYCNADMGLTIASGLPLRSSYRGPRNADGGFTRNGCRDPKASAGRQRLPAAKEFIESSDDDQTRHYQR